MLYGGVELGDLLQIGLWGKLTFAHPAFQPLAQKHYILEAAFAQERTRCVRTLLTMQRPQHDHASMRLARMRVRNCGLLEKIGNTFLCRRRCRQSVLDTPPHLIRVKFHRRPEQASLAAESRVKAWCIDLHGLRQIAHGSAVIAFLPENAHRAFQCGITVKGAGPALRQHGNLLL
jgi:hypothetical protein